MLSSSFAGALTSSVASGIVSDCTSAAAAAFSSSSFLYFLRLFLEALDAFFSFT